MNDTIYLLQDLKYPWTVGSELFLKEGKPSWHTLCKSITYRLTEYRRA